MLKKAKSERFDLDDERFYLPGEQNTLKRILRGKPANLLLYFFGTLILCLGLLCLLEWWRHPLNVIYEYGHLVFMVLLAVFGNIAFWLYLSHKCQNLFVKPKNDVLFLDKQTSIKLLFESNTLFFKFLDLLCEPKRLCGEPLSC